MKSLTSIASRLPKFLLLVLFLALAPTALASNTWYVDSVNGNDTNDCKTTQTACKTIGHAISLAKSGDSIMVAPATYTENLTIRKNLKVIGSDAATTIVDGGGASTVFTIPFSRNQRVHVRLSKLTIRNGNGAGIYNGGILTVNYSTIKANKAPYDGGGISNDGTLTVNRSTIIGNSAGVGGGIENNGGTVTISHSTISGNDSVYGGGIVSMDGGTLTVNRSTISGNSASEGGGIWGAVGTLTVNNSTISGNSATQYGGAVKIKVETTLLSINNSTIRGNRAMWHGGGIVSEFDAVVTLQNSILAGATSGGNCYTTGRTMTSQGYNLSDDNTCNFSGPGDMNNTQPLLGKLGNHGGPTQTILLLEGSPAIDAGNPNGCTDGNGNLFKTDQRGYPRPDKEDTGGCDMGSYERQQD
jgi:hypothetical protein